MLRRKAARYFENAASAETSEEAEKLREIGRQLELWADDFEDVERRGQKPKQVNPADDKNFGL